MKCKPTSCFDLAPIPKLPHYYSDIARPQIIHNVNISWSKDEIVNPGLISAVI